MIISAPTDYREAARRRLPRFLFDYLDGGANGEHTLRRNISDLSDVTLRQRVLRDVADISLKTRLFDQDLAMPIALAPVGLAGIYARRGEVQAARAAEKAGIGYSLSTVSVCSLEEVSAAVRKPIWFQLYVLKDRGFMKSVLERALARGITTLIFTVDMPVPGSRYRDAHAGMSGPMAPLRRMALEADKLVYMAIPRLPADRCFVELTLARVRAAGLTPAEAAFHKTAVEIGRPVSCGSCK